MPAPNPAALEPAQAPAAETAPRPAASGQGCVPRAAMRSCSASGAAAGSPVPPYSRQVARENWYFPRYWPLGGDRGRVAAGLALGDPGQRALGAPLAAAARGGSRVGRGRRGRAARPRWRASPGRRCRRRRGPGCAGSCARRGAWSGRTTPSARDAERALQRGDGRARAAHGARARAAALRERAAGGEGQRGGGDERAGRRRRSRLRAWRASSRRARERRLDSSHGTWFDRSSLGTSVQPPGSWGLRG